MISFLLFVNDAMPIRPLILIFLYFFVSSITSSILSSSKPNLFSHLLYELAINSQLFDYFV